jgi:glycosyltransferase involved in cell wall biosynthesis
MSPNAVDAPDDVKQSAAVRPGQKIRVVHLLHSVAYGGPETIVINCLRTQNKERFDVHLICFAQPNGCERPFVEAARAAGLSMHFIPWDRSKPVLKSARALTDYLREHQIDILHCYNTYAELVGVVAKRRTGVRLITTKWMWGKLDWKRAILQRLERFLVRYFDRVSAQSEFAARLTVQPGLPLERIEVLLSGSEQPLTAFSPDERTREREKLGARPDDIVFLHLARFHAEKAHDVLLRSFRQIVNACPNTRLWLCGVGPGLEAAQSLARELGLESSARFLGFKSDLSRLLPLADIQIHSSHMEGIPLALCSGLAAGLPIVATAVGGVPEIVQHNVNGLLVPPNRPDLLAESALRLADDRALREQFGEAARRFMRERYSLKAAVARLESVYEEMMGA